MLQIAKRANCSIGTYTQSSRILSHTNWFEQQQQKTFHIHILYILFYAPHHRLLRARARSLACVFVCVCDFYYYYDCTRRAYFIKAIWNSWLLYGTRNRLSQFSFCIMYFNIFNTLHIYYDARARDFKRPCWSWRQKYCDWSYHKRAALLWNLNFRYRYTYIDYNI